jgi:hypothetical protein
MSYLDDYSLPRFVELVAKGDLGPSLYAEIPNMSGNEMKRVSFLDHCDALCERHKTNRLRLLSVIQQKLNGDMIVRLNQSPVFKDKVSRVLSEWGDNDKNPVELFGCPESCYDQDNLTELMDKIRSYEEELKSLDTDIDENDTGLYNSLEGLRSNFHGCGENLQSNLLQIEDRYNEYEPLHRGVLCDLSTRHKPFYLDELMNEDKEGKMIHHVNKRVNRHIPDKINMIFLNIVLVPTLMAKEMETNKHKCLSMKSGIDEKQQRLGEIMERIGPNEPLSVGFLRMLSDLTSVFGSNSDEELPSDDDDDGVTDEKIEEVMQKIVNKSEPPNDMFYMAIEPNKEENVDIDTAEAAEADADADADADTADADADIEGEEEAEEQEGEEQGGGAIPASFF